MLIEVKYEYQTRPKKDFIEIKNATNGTTVKIATPNEYWKGTTYVKVDDKTNANQLVSKMESYLHNECNALLETIQIKKMNRISVIDL